MGRFICGKASVFVAGIERKNAYAVLGLHKGANPDQVKQAYIQLVKRYDPEAHTERFMIIEEPFSVENGLLTPTMKIRRRLILEENQEGIKTLYSTPRDKQEQGSADQGN